MPQDQPAVYHRKIYRRDPEPQYEAIQYTGDNLQELARFGPEVLIFVKTAAPADVAQASSEPADTLFPMLKYPRSRVLQRLEVNDYLIRRLPDAKDPAPKSGKTQYPHWNLSPPESHHRNYAAPADSGRPHRCQPLPEAEEDQDPTAVALQFTGDNFAAAQQFAEGKLCYIAGADPVSGAAVEIITLNNSFRDLLAVEQGDWLVKPIDEEHPRGDPEYVDVVAKDEFAEEYEPVNPTQ